MSIINILICNCTELIVFLNSLILLPQFAEYKRNNTVLKLFFKIFIPVYIVDFVTDFEPAIEIN